jgi:hypothetical protein
MGGAHGAFRFPPFAQGMRVGNTLTYLFCPPSHSQRKCTRRHPPGRKVYQRGAHTIWEVDGAKEKVRVEQGTVGSFNYSFFLIPREQLYCQNLSLFGKLFIDIKTLFFDTDNCEHCSSLSPLTQQLLMHVSEQSFSTSLPTPTPNEIMSWVSFQR